MHRRSPTNNAHSRSPPIPNAARYVRTAGDLVYLIISTSKTNIGAESLVPFDLESTWSASVVILVAHAVDPSLLRNVDELRQIAFAILSEMVARGNRVAAFYKEELELLEHHLRELASGAVNLGYDAAGAGPASNSNSESTSAAGNFDSTGFSTGQPALQEWYFDDGVIDGEQLMRAAESLDVGAFQWYTDDGGAFEGLDASLL